MDKKIHTGIEKVLIIITLVIAAAVLVILTYRANYDIDAEYVYSVLDGKNITIDGYTGDTANLIIPEEIDGYTVKYIGKEAFADMADRHGYRIEGRALVLDDNAAGVTDVVDHIFLVKGLDARILLRHKSVVLVDVYAGDECS